MPPPPAKTPPVRPGFPLRLDALQGGARAASGARAPQAVAPPRAPVHGVGMDSQAVRRAMVERLAAQGVGGEAVLGAMAVVERHRFVDTALVGQAYEDTSLPIGLEQTISKPSVVARMIGLLLEAPAVASGRVLEIGTGCGYQAAVLSRLVREVYSVERLRGLHERARSNLRALRVPNLHLLLGDGMLGYAAGAPYSGILAAAGGEDVPPAWLEQLAPGGRLVAPITVGPSQQALLVIDRAATGWRRRVLEPVRFVPLKSGLA